MLVSCVGKVEDTALDTTKNIVPKSQILDYDGIDRAIAISDFKVEVYFSPSTHDQTKITYQISYDGLSVPITIPGVLLRPDYRGLNYYMITGLDDSKPYNFSVEIFDDDDKKSDSGFFEVATTFDKLTANFQGVTSVSNTSGSSALTTITVDWALAAMTGSIASPAITDTAYYEVTVISADVYNPGDMNNDDFGEPDRKVLEVAKSVSSATITGLTPDSRYFVQVRAIHYDYVDNGKSIDYLPEQNTKYLEISTSSSNIPIVAAFDLSLPSGDEGLTNINTSWEAGPGSFDHYRIYYTKSDAPNDGDLPPVHTIVSACDGTAVSDTYCKKILDTTTSLLITNVLANTSYDFLLVICQNLDCSSNNPSVVKSITTTPPVADFAGIQNITGPNDVNNLDHIYVAIGATNTSTGFVDGLLIEHTNPLDGSPDILNLPGGSLTELELLEFDHTTDATITVTGADPTASRDYCFVVFPFTYDFAGNVIEHRGTFQEQCIPNLSILPPTDAQFTGATNCIPHATMPGAVIVEWDTPTGGVYSSFEVYYKTTPGIFDYDVAPVSYSKKVVSMEKNATTITNLNSGATVAVGVLTNINILGVDSRSIKNTSGVDACVVP